jgi:hypothetical protein
MQVAFNAVDEWRTYYIDYDKLKTISLNIERLVCVLCIQSDFQHNDTSCVRIASAKASI